MTTVEESRQHFLPWGNTIAKEAKQHGARMQQEPAPLYHEQ